MALEPIGDISDVTLTENTAASNEPLAHSLSRKRNDVASTVIEDESGVSARKALMFDRRNHGNQTP